MTESLDIIKENNEVKKYLIKDNKEYYDDLLVYCRSKSLLLDEKQLEGVLFELLTDLLEAQRNGQTALEYFGKNPKELSDSILHELKKESFPNLLKLVFSAFCTFLVFFSLPEIMFPEKGLDIGKFLLQFLLLLPFLWLIFKIISEEIYSPKKILYWLFMTLTISAYLVLFIAINEFTPAVFVLHTYGTVSIAYIAAALLIILYIFFKNGKTQMYLFALLPAAILGILSRLAIFEDFFQSSARSFMETSVSLLSYGLFIALTLWQIKRSE